MKTLEQVLAGHNDAILVKAKPREAPKAISRRKGGTRSRGSGVKKRTSQKKFPASCVKCGCRLSAKTALDWDVPGPSSTHRFICAECAEEEGLTD